MENPNNINNATEQQDGGIRNHLEGTHADKGFISPSNTAEHGKYGSISISPEQKSKYVDCIANNIDKSHLKDNISPHLEQLASENKVDGTNIEDCNLSNGIVGATLHRSTDGNGKNENKENGPVNDLNSEHLPIMPNDSTMAGASAKPIAAKKQKAKKSCANSSNTDNLMKEKSEAVTKIVPPFTKRSIKVTELESVLGLAGQSIDKVDAKTLDKLVLQKAQKRNKVEVNAELSGICEQSNQAVELDVSNSTNYINASDISSKHIKELVMGSKLPGKSDSASIASESSVGTGCTDGSFEKSLRKKRKMKRGGTYYLPGTKQAKKKKLDKPKPSDKDEIKSTSEIVPGDSSCDVSNVTVNTTVDISNSKMDCDTNDGVSSLPIARKDHSEMKGHSESIDNTKVKENCLPEKEEIEFKPTAGEHGEIKAEDEVEKVTSSKNLSSDCKPKKAQTQLKITEMMKPAGTARKSQVRCPSTCTEVDEKPTVGTLGAKMGLEKPIFGGKLKVPGGRTVITPTRAEEGFSFKRQRLHSKFPKTSTPKFAQRLNQSLKLEDNQPVFNYSSPGFLSENTPNGLSYPPVPLDLDIEDPEAAQGECKMLGSIPLCMCRSNKMQKIKAPHCQALDCRDGKVSGCFNKSTTGACVYRPGVCVPYMALCESHRTRLVQHECCATCGHFCTQGTFYQCRKEGPVHLSHKQCMVYRDDKYFCPHCGEESLRVAVTMNTLPPPQNTGATTKTSSTARMGKQRSSIESQASVDSQSAVSTTSKGSGRSLANNKFIPLISTKELEAALAGLAQDDRTKRVRPTPKSLFTAVKAGEMNKVMALLADGADVNCVNEDTGSQTVLHVAAEKGFTALGQILIQAGANIHAMDSDLRTPLMNAAEKGHTAIVQLLLKLGAIPDCRAHDGMTSLHLAAQSGKVASVTEIILTQAVDINVKDDGGWTPLIWAAEYGHTETVKYLMNAGSDPTLRDNEENTGLHWASFAGSSAIADMFLRAGCDIDSSNEVGDRPLHIAARQCHYELVQFLLAKGADSTVRNNRCELPTDCVLDKSSPTYLAIRLNQQLRVLAHHRLVRPPKLLHRDISLAKEQYPIAIVNEHDEDGYPTDYQYVNECVETSPMHVNKVITSLQACSCTAQCESVHCTCTRNSVRCWYNDEGLLVEEFNFHDTPYIFECNRACHCWKSCKNRVIQLGISSRLEVFRTVGKGWGVRTLLDIKKGSFVCEYIGELICDAEADQREDDSYLFDLDNRDSDSFCIDARRFGNVSRFINHQCDPNLTAVKVFVDHQDLRFPRICFFANRDIPAQHELGFDYGDKFWIIKYHLFTCNCGAAKCRYSKDTIDQTVKDYYSRLEEVE